MASDFCPPWWLAISVAGANLLALADWPYGYYQLLRLVVTGYALWVTLSASANGARVWPWVFGFIAVLYNPVFKISLDRETHEVVNVGVAVVILLELWSSRGRSAPI